MLFGFNNPTSMAHFERPGGDVRPTTAIAIALAADFDLNVLARICLVRDWRKGLGV